jgi:alkanesulfonate monooxygenase SsuD/methylene tetrahydromethanopterin reductase-like flavin-dependent oxidoreductase (luciferase family)
MRIAQMVEAIELIRRMWTEAPASYKGQHYQIEGAYCEPRPDPLPPIMIGGAGETYLLRAVAQHADWWNYVFTDAEAYTHKQAILQEHCRAVGRDYDAIEQVVQLGVLIAETEDEVRRLQEQPEVRPPGERRDRHARAGRRDTAWHRQARGGSSDRTLR